jgi:hypothetical protein
MVGKQARFSSIRGTLQDSWRNAGNVNLQIRSDAMYFMVLLALAWISLAMGRRERTGVESPSPTPLHHHPRSL